MAYDPYDKLLEHQRDEAVDRLRTELDEAWQVVSALMAECKTIGLLLADAQERLRKLSDQIGL